MRRVWSIIGALLLVPYSVSLYAGDTVLHRSVTVEREFQPIIQAAGKINKEPVVLETTFEPAEVQYSDFTTVLAPSFNTTSLLSQPMRFTTPEVKNGYISGALGHPLTRFDFLYHIDDGKKSILDIFAHHNAQWGKRALSVSNLGFDFHHPFSRCDLYFGLQGGNLFYKLPGKNDGKMNNWDFEMKFGVRANKKQEFQYDFSVGYYLGHLPEIVSEHQLRTKLNMEWTGSDHHAGANIYVQNNFTTPDTAAWNFFQRTYILSSGREEQTHNFTHAIRVEPFYAYYGRRFNLHLGVNVDLNFGRGKLLSGSKNIAFAPSPNIRFEAQLAKSWLTLYGDIKGHFGLASEQEWLNENLYAAALIGVGDEHVSPYTPVDGLIGFHIKPQKWLLMELHAGYALMLNECATYASAPRAEENDKLVGWYDHIETDYQRVKVGAALSFHYQDIISIHLWGDYYSWKRMAILNEKSPVGCTLDKDATLTDERVYDRPEWEIGLRIDGRIDEHWSVYSDNHFAGSRWARAYDGDHRLKPLVDINLGAQYDWKEKNLTFFAQLNNIIHRHNDLYYAYDSMGINGLVGITWRF